MEKTNTKSKDKTNKTPTRPETEKTKLNVIFLETNAYCIWAQKGWRNGYRAYVRLPTKGEVQRLGYTSPGQVLK